MLIRKMFQKDKKYKALKSTDKEQFDSQRYNDWICPINRGICTKIPQSFIEAENIQFDLYDGFIYSVVIMIEFILLVEYSTVLYDHMVI